MFTISLGSRVRKSPFFEATVKAGVRNFSVYNHMLMPTGYGDPQAEYWRLINAVAIWDVAIERQVEIRGPDADHLAQALVPRDLSNCRIGQGKYAPLCDHAGRLINDPVLLKLEACRYWLSLADSDILLWARAVAAERQFAVEVFEPDVSPLAIQGPKAQAVARDLFGDWINDIRFFGFRQTDLDGIPLLLARSGWSKQGGFELYLQDGSRGEELWNKVWEAGQRYAMGPGTPNAQERVESALLSFRSDTDDDCNPLEVGLERYLDLAAPVEYIGKSALQEIARQGPRRRRVGLLLDTQPMTPCQQPWPVSYNGQPVGTVSSAVWSPRLEHNIALALLNIEAASPGTAVDIQSPERILSAEVTGLPFI